MSESIEETTHADSEGIKNLRSAYETQHQELIAARRELAFTKLGVNPNEDQAAALEAVLQGDWSDPDVVVEKYTSLFGSSEPSSQPEPQVQQTEMTGQTVSEAPAPPGGAILDNVSGLTAGGSVPLGEELPEDPVAAGYAERRKDLEAGRPRQDAASQVLNRLIDRGARDLPGGQYNHDEYQRMLSEGRAGRPPSTRLVD